MFVEDSSVVKASIIENGKAGSDKISDDEFVSNPPPAIRAPAVIEVPSFENEKNSRRRIGSFRRQSKKEKNSDNDLFIVPDDGIHNSEGSQEFLSSYRLGLLCSNLFLVSACCYLAAAVLGLVLGASSSNTNITSILSLVAYAGFLVVGGVQIFTTDTLCARCMIGVNMVLASASGIVSAVLMLLPTNDDTVADPDFQTTEGTTHQYQYTSSILAAVSAHLFAVVAISSFILHERMNNDDGIENIIDDDGVKKQRYLHKPSAKHSTSDVWRRLADNAFMAATLTDAVLSYFYIFETQQQDVDDALDASSNALLYASIGAASFWVVASILYLFVTVQSHRQAGHVQQDASSCCVWLCGCCGHHEDEDDLFNIDTVAITVVEGDNANTEVKHVVQDKGVFSLCATSDFDNVCTGANPFASSQNNNNTTQKSTSGNAKDDPYCDPNIFCN